MGFPYFGKVPYTCCGIRGGSLKAPQARESRVLPVLLLSPMFEGPQPPDILNFRCLLLPWGSTSNMRNSTYVDLQDNNIGEYFISGCCGRHAWPYTVRSKWHGSLRCLFHFPYIPRASTGEGVSLLTCLVRGDPVSISISICSLDFPLLPLHTGPHIMIRSHIPHILST